MKPQDLFFAFENQNKKRPTALSHLNSIRHHAKIAIVRLLLPRIRQRLVRLVDGLEPPVRLGLGGAAAGVLVRVVHQRQFPVRLLDLRLARAPVDAQDLVEPVRPLQQPLQAVRHAAVGRRFARMRLRLSTRRRARVVVVAGAAAVVAAVARIVAAGRAGTAGAAGLGVVLGGLRTATRAAAASVAVAVIAGVSRSAAAGTSGLGVVEGRSTRVSRGRRRTARLASVEAGRRVGGRAASRAPRLRVETGGVNMSIRAVRGVAGRSRRAAGVSVMPEGLTTVREACVVTVRRRRATAVGEVVAAVGAFELVPSVILGGPAGGPTCCTSEPIIVVEVIIVGEPVITAEPIIAVTTPVTRILRLRVAERRGTAGAAARPTMNVAAAGRRR